MNELFPTDFLAAIDLLSVSVSQVPPRIQTGQHLSPRAGASLQFRDFKHYSPGDDLRRIDWNVYSRTRHLFVRRFDQPTAIPMTLLVDSSTSMHLEEPSRYATAARLAAAVASAALSAQNPLQMMVADRDGTLINVSSGQRGLLQVLTELSRHRTSSSTSISQSIEALLPLISRRSQGILVVVSDFFDDRGAEQIASALQQYQGRVLCIRLTHPWDRDPDVTGDVELVDCESNVAVQSTPSAAVMDRYRVAYDTYFAKLEEALKRRAARLISIDASQPTRPQLEQIFPNGTLSL